MLETILTRRSIRKYRDLPVDELVLDKILRAAMYAPSARDTRPWHFIVCDTRAGLDKLRTAHPFASALATAPIAILVCGDITLECAPGYYLIDCSLAVENITLAAHSLGLGTCIMGVAPREERMSEMRESFALPENIQPHTLIALGYPDECRTVEERYDSTRVHRGLFGQK